MAITPVDIRHTQFRTSLKGYNREQVDEFVRNVAQALEETLTAKSELQRRVELLQEEIDRVKDIESTLTSALTLAQKTAEEVRTNAHREAEMILREAEQSRVRMIVEAQNEAERLRSELALLQSTRDRFVADFRAMLGGYIEWLDALKSCEETRAEVA
jgi:cell division initiation protein